MSRRQFFSDMEKKILQKLIFKYKIDSITTMDKKRKAWSCLTNDFNSIEMATRRTEAQLKKCWDNIKTRRKQAFAAAAAKKERMRTGEGFHSEPFTFTATEVSQELKEVDPLEKTNSDLQFVLDNVDVLEDDAYIGVSMKTEKTNEEPPAEGSSQVASQSGSGGQANPQSESHGVQPDTVNASDHQILSEDMKLRSFCIEGPQNVRARVIDETLRQRNYKRAQEREEELHRLYLAEKEWHVRSAKEQFRKAFLERQSAEELLRYNRAKREEAEFTLFRLKNN